jgi:hypothetical protein
MAVCGRFFPGCAAWGSLEATGAGAVRDSGNAVADRCRASRWSRMALARSRDSSCRRTGQLESQPRSQTETHNAASDIRGGWRRRLSRDWGCSRWGVLLVHRGELTEVAPRSLDWVCEGDRPVLLDPEQNRRRCLVESRAQKAAPEDAGFSACTVAVVCGCRGSSTPTIVLRCGCHRAERVVGIRERLLKRQPGCRRNQHQAHRNTHTPPSRKHPFSRMPYRPDYWGSRPALVYRSNGLRGIPTPDNQAGLQMID